MARRGENIYLRKDGRWEGRYIKGRRPDGKPLFGSVYGRQYAEVRKRLILRKAEMYANGKPTTVICGDGSFEDWTVYWLEVYARPYVKPETYAGYERTANNHIFPHLGNMNIREIQPVHIQNMVNELQKNLAPTTLRSVCRLLKSILKTACEKEVISHSPYQDIRLPRVRKNAPRVLTFAEQRKLEKELYRTNELEYLLCLYTGLRVGELCALRWKDIDFESNMLYVRHSVQRIPVKNDINRTKLILSSPKSESSIRDIPIPYFIEEMLRLRKEETRADLEDYIFPGITGASKDPRTMQYRIVKLCRELDIEDVHMHTLRHTFATRCLERGIHYEILCEFLGHSSPQITLRHYAHCTPDGKRRSMDKMELIYMEETQ